MSRPRTVDARPTVSDWTGTDGATENPRQTRLSFSSDTSARSNHKNLSLVFSPSFDDSLYGQAKAWIINHPGGNLAWDLATVSTATTPATSDISGAAVGGSPAGAVSINTATAYDSATKDLGFVQVQLDASSQTAEFDTADQLVADPVLAFELLRADPANHALAPDLSGLDESQGYLFTFSDVELYEASSDGRWTYIGGIQEESFDIRLNTETVSWTKSKPAVIVHQAVSAINADASFRLDHVDPRWLARAIDAVASDNASANTIDIVFDGRPRSTVTGAYVLQWRTIGGHVVRLSFPKAKLSVDGGYRPGDSNFTGMSFMLTGQASGANREVATMAISSVPVEQVLIPMSVAVSTP